MSVEKRVSDLRSLGCDSGAVPSRDLVRSLLGRNGERSKRTPVVLNLKEPTVDVVGLGTDSRAPGEEHTDGSIPGKGTY